MRNQKVLKPGNHYADTRMGAALYRALEGALSRSEIDYSEDGTRLVAWCTRPEWNRVMRMARREVAA